MDARKVMTEVADSCTSLEEMAKLQPFMRNEIFDERVRQQHRTEKNIAKAKADFLKADSEQAKLRAMDQLANSVKDINRQSLDSRNFNNLKTNGSEFKKEDTIVANMIFSCRKMQRDLRELFLVYFDYDHVIRVQDKTSTDSDFPTSTDDLSDLHRKFQAKVDPKNVQKLLRLNGTYFEGKN